MFIYLKKKNSCCTSRGSQHITVLGSLNLNFYFLLLFLIFKDYLFFTWTLNFFPKKCLSLLSFRETVAIKRSHLKLFFSAINIYTNENKWSRVVWNVSIYWTFIEQCSHIILIKSVYFSNDFLLTVWETFQQAVQRNFTFLAMARTMLNEDAIF